jgi:hypothetical protein
MASKVSQRAVYLVTAAIVVAMVGGFALATMALGGTSTSYQGSQTTTVSSLPGLTWDFTAPTEVNVTTPFAVPCGSSAAAACDVTTVGKTVCAGSFGVSMCAQGDFIEEVNLTTVTATPFFGSSYPVIVSLTVSVTGTPFGGTQGTYEGSPIYFTETASNTAVYIALDFDVGVIPNGPGSVTSISVIAHT